MPKRTSKLSKRSVKKNRKFTDKVSGSKKKTEVEESDKPLVQSSTDLKRYKQIEAEIKQYNPKTIQIGISNAKNSMKSPSIFKETIENWVPAIKYS